MEQMLMNDTALEAPVRRNPYAEGAAAPAATAEKSEKKKGGRSGWKALAVILCILLALNLLVSAVSLGLQAVNTLGSGMIDFDDILPSFDVAREDGVVIGWEYKIESTRQISDAYLSGDTAGLSDRDLETLDMAKAVLDRIIKPGMTDFEKEVAVYEWLTTKLESETGILTVIPTGTDESDNPYGVLKYRSAVCVGYATTFRLFMQMLGIECMVVHDSSLSHSWDLVQLDGEWYHTDCYYDSPEGNFQHFNLNDAQRSMEQDWNTSFFPAAEGTKYNYAVYTSVPLADIYAIPAWLKAGLDDGKKMLSCRFETPPENEEAALYMADRSLEAASYSGLYGEFYYDHYWTADEDGNYVLCVYFTYYDDENGYGLPETEREKIEQAVADVFGDGWEDERDYEPETDIFGFADDLLNGLLTPRG